MANVLNKEKQDQVLALGRLGWALRRIEKATGVRRETASAYLRAAGIAVRPAGRWGRAPPNPANEVTADLGANSAEALQLSNPANEVTADSGELAHSDKSFASPFRELIEDQLARGRNAFGIYQQLVDHNGFTASYESVKRFVRALKKNARPQAHAVIETAPGEEGQVDYGDGPMVRHPESGKYRRTRLFVFTLGYSRKSVRLLTWKSRDYSVHPFQPFTTAPSRNEKFCCISAALFQRMRARPRGSDDRQGGCDNPSRVPRHRVSALRKRPTPSRANS